MFCVRAFWERFCEVPEVEPRCLYPDCFAIGLLQVRDIDLDTLPNVPSISKGRIMQHRKKLFAPSCLCWLFGGGEIYFSILNAYQFPFKCNFWICFQHPFRYPNPNHSNIAFLSALLQHYFISGPMSGYCPGLDAGRHGLHSLLRSCKWNWTFPFLVKEGDWWSS